MAQASSAAVRWQRRQRGASAVEFALVAVPLLLVGLLVVEVASALAARQVLRLALHEATRAGAVQHGNPQVMGAAFEAALAPWYAPAGRYGSPRARLRASHAQLQRDTGLPLWQLEILGPDARAGPQPGLTIFDADVLHLRAVWLRRPLTPLTGAVLKAAARVAAVVSETPPTSPTDAATTTSRRALAAGLLPLVVGERMTMHSDPQVWPQSVVSAGAVR